MGDRGPRAVPKGSTKKRTIKAADYGSGEHLQPPRGMARDAKKLWREITQDFKPGFHQKKHVPLLELFCVSYANWRRASGELAKSGLVVTNSVTGAVKKSPLLNIMDAESAKMLQAAGKLGLVVDPQSLGSDISFTSVPDEKLAAYKALKLRQPVLKGADLELFKKLQEIFKNDTDQA